jgi:hypothetical protein
MDQRRETSPALQEARRLRDLGRWPEAAQVYRAEQEHNGSLLLSVEFASMFLEQGWPKMTAKEVEAGIAEFSDVETTSIAAALAKLLRAATLAATTVCFTEPLNTAVELHDRYLKARETEEYDHHMVWTGFVQ